MGLYYMSHHLVELISRRGAIGSNPPSEKRKYIQRILPEHHLTMEMAQNLIYILYHTISTLPPRYRATEAAGKHGESEKWAPGSGVEGTTQLGNSLVAQLGGVDGRKVVASKLLGGL